MLKPSTEPNITFFVSADMTTVCQNLGEVSELSSLDPSKCLATGKGVELAVVGEKSTAVLQAINFKGQPCEEPIESLECELVSVSAKGSMERSGQSEYQISYQPTVNWRHQLHIKIKGQHIRRSPFSVVTMPPPTKFSTPIHIIAGVITPHCTAINQRGEIAVTEWDRCCVSMFTSSREKICSFGTYGSGPGQFFHPRGVTFDGDGNILVADRGNHRIQKFTPEGKFLTTVGIMGDGPLQFNVPVDIVFNPTNNKVYVVDLENHRIQVLNSDLTFSSTFGKHGSKKQCFDRPGGIACDSTGKVYVPELDSDHIQVFTAEGKFLRIFGKSGKGKGELNCPGNITIDTNDLVYISEYKNNRVSLFTTEGQFVMSFGSEGEEPGEFNLHLSPRGVAVDNSGLVYVCDPWNNRVQVF